MGKKRKIIKIDEEKCTGCGLCIPNCPEGALQVIDGKARLISDLFCDGLGACVGTCPEGALTIEEREAEPYDERRVMANIVKAGANTIAAHLRHLKEHGAERYYQEAVAYLREHRIPIPKENFTSLPCGCPGTAVQSMTSAVDAEEIRDTRPSRLSNWPVQLMLVPVNAPYFNNGQLVIAADCVGFAQPDFHECFLKGKVLLVCCPKLDDAQFYVEKLTRILQENKIIALTVLHMEVPCCFGLMAIVREALKLSGKNIPLTEFTIRIDGRIKE